MVELSRKSAEQRPLRIGIGSHGSIKERLLAAARGEKPFGPDEPKLWFASLNALLSVLTPENRQMMAIIAQEHPRSISALAQRVGRDQGNVSRALALLEQHGFVRLTREGREKRPEAAIMQIDLRLDLSQERIEITIPPPALTAPAKNA
jgi:predicted transcriptional regulator